MISTEKSDADFEIVNSQTNGAFDRCCSLLNLSLRRLRMRSARMVEVRGKW